MIVTAPRARSLGCLAILVLGACDAGGSGTLVPMDAQDAAETSQSDGVTPDGSDALHPDAATQDGLGNLPPTASIGSPVDGATVTGKVQVEVAAADDHGVVKVLVTVDDKPGAELTTAPYRWTWDTTGLVDGPHVLKATAYDAQYKAGSASVTVVVRGECAQDGTCPPRGVRFITPVDGATVCGTLTLEALATDEHLAQMEFRVDDQPLGSDLQAPYQWTLDTRTLAPGAHVLKVIATNAAGKSAFATAGVTVDNSKAQCDNLPSVRIVEPETEAYLSGVVPVKASASDDVGVTKVQFFVDNGLLFDDTATPYGFEWNTGDFEEGAHTLKAIALDTSSQVASTQVTVTVDRTPPQVLLDAPRSGDTVGNAVAVAASVSDNFKVARVTFRLGNGAVEATLTQAPWSTTLDATSLPAGESTVEAVAEDGVGLTATARVTIRISHCDVAGGTCECDGPEDCVGRGYCLDGTCRADLVCQPGARSCDGNTATECSADGKTLDEEDCVGQTCFEGRCVLCAPGAVDCPQVNVARVCRMGEGGVPAWEERQCGDLRCVNGDCVACVPGQRTCMGSSVMACAADGSDVAFVEDCDPESTGRMCHLGTCLNLCEFNSKFSTNEGCEYWATDLDQFNDPTDAEYSGGVNAPFALVVSNTNEDFKATIRVTNTRGFDRTYEALPRKATIINLEPLNISGSELSDKAWHVTSTLPVVAYQFNPLENVKVFSNDASLLLPVTALGRKYRVMAWPTMGLNSAGQQLSSFMTIVATEDGDTEVNVTPTARILAGQGVTATPANLPKAWKLSKGQVLNLEAADVGGDFTGSLVQADKRIAVFGGHVCANAPISRCSKGTCSYDPATTCTADADCPSIGACDHLEEQIQPLGTLGKRYVIARTMARGKAPDVLRILAAQDGTHVTTVPVLVTIPTLDAGEWFEFEISDHVELASDKPVMVGHYLEGQNAPGAAHDGCYDAAPCAEVTLAGKECACQGGAVSGEVCSTDSDCIDGSCYYVELCEASSRTGKSCICASTQATCQRQSQCSPDDANIGDPSQMMGVPVEQFRKEYVFLTPIKYRDSYVSIVAPVDATVTLDDSVLSESLFKTLPSGEWKVARLPVPAGSHTLSSDQRVGLDVYGWDFYVSYAYPGGMNLDTLTAF